MPLPVTPPPQAPPQSAYGQPAPAPGYGQGPPAPPPAYGEPQGYPPQGYPPTGYPPPPPGRSRGGSGPLIAVIAAVVVLVVLVGAGGYWFWWRNRDANGVQNLPADQILSTALSTAKSQSSVHIVVADDADSGDLTLVRGSGGFGSITDANGTLKLVVTKDTVYVKGSGQQWEDRLGPEAVATIGDRWLSEPVADGGNFSEMASVFEFEGALDGILAPDSGVTKGAEGEANGQPAVSLTSSDGTLWVAMRGPALPLLIEGNDGQRATFSNWNANVTVQPPPADQVIAADQVDVATDPGPDATDEPTSEPTEDGTDVGSWGDETPQVETVIEFLLAVQNGEREYADSLCTEEFLAAGGIGPTPERLESFEVVSAEPAGDSVAVTVEEVWGENAPVTATYFVVMWNGFPQIQSME